MLEFDHVSFTYPDAQQPTLQDISATFPEGSFVSIVGASGSGKTTLFRLMNGLETPDSGAIYLNGEAVKEGSGTIGYMPQQDLLFPWFTVLRNVMLPMEIKKLPKEECRRRALQMLEQVGLSDWAASYPRALSGGMRQRVSFARTLAAGSKVLLLDEPFSALDSITRIALQEWLREQWAGLGKTIVFITHDVEEALYLSESVYVLTGQPASELRQFEVPLPQKRSRDMLLRPELLTMKEQLISLLRQEAGL